MRPISSAIHLFTVLAATTALAAAPIGVSAQETGTITGTVSDATTGRPLVQAQVSVPGTNRGTLTNEAGRYLVLEVPAGEQEIRVELIGYTPVVATVEVPPGGTVTRSFELSSTAISLDEIVVTATGQQRAREVANAVGQLNAVDQIEKAPTPSLSSLLQGQVPSINIQQPSGAVGAASTFNIRGNTSLGLDNTPIIYIDGARIDNSNSIGAGAGGQDFTRLNDLSPENIASIEVVKGPAAATLYGTEASAGVIRITTRRGLTGEPRWNVWAEQGAMWENVDWWEMAWNPTNPFVGLPALFGDPSIEPVKDTTYIFSTLEDNQPIPTPWRTGHNQGYGASVRGGNEAFTYFVSGDYRSLEGVLPSDNVERFNARANFDATISEDLQLSISNGFVDSRAQLPTNDNSLFSLVGNSLGTSWQGKLLRSDPVDGGDPIETCMLAFEFSRAEQFPLQTATDILCSSPLFQGEGSNEAILDLINTDDTRRYTGSATATWTPLEFLQSRFTLGVDEVATRIRNITPVDPNRIFGSLSDGVITRTDFQTFALTLEASSSANFDLTDDVNSITTVGFQFNQEQTDVTSVTGRNFPAGSPAVNNSVETEATDAFAEEKTLGIYVQEQLSFRDRVFLTPAVRFDDNSAFGEDLGIQAYPRVGLSWVMSEEEWFPETFDQFRFRGAWGQSGKQPGPNDALALLSVGPVAFRQGNVLGFTPNRPGNPELKPETGTEIELGFDASLFENRLGIELTWFDKRTEDAIVARPDAFSLGFPGNRFVNVGEIKNTGFEIVLDGDVIRTDAFGLQLRGTLATLDNEVTDLPEPIPFGAQRHQQGLPFAAYWDAPVTIDADGNVVVADEKEFIGQPTPKWEGALSTTVDLFDWVTLYALFDYKGGHKLFDGTEELNCALIQCPAIFETGPDGELTDDARRKLEGVFVGTVEPFLYDADFVKLRTVSLRLHVPSRLVGNLGAEAASLTISGDNLVTWTDFPGTDPEANFAGSNQVVRQEFIGMPQMPRFTARLSLTY